MQRQEAFTIENLGNRDLVNVRDGNEKGEIGNRNRWLSLVALVFTSPHAFSDEVDDARCD